MPIPTALAIAVSSVQRLVKEEIYYHKELVAQKMRIEKLESDIEAQSSELDENAEYVLRQEKQAMEETKTVLVPLRSRIRDAVSKLEEQIAISETSGDHDHAADAELARAKQALQLGHEALNPGA